MKLPALKRDLSKSSANSDLTSLVALMIFFLRPPLPLPEAAAAAAAALAATACIRANRASPMASSSYSLSSS